MILLSQKTFNQKRELQNTVDLYKSFSSLQNGLNSSRLRYFKTNWYNLNPNKDKTKVYLISFLSIANVYFQMLIQIGCKQPSLSNREGGGNDASWTAKANTHTHYTVHELVWYKQSHTLSLDTRGSQQCTKKRFRDAIYL